MIRKQFTLEVLDSPAIFVLAFVGNSLIKFSALKATSVTM